MRLIFFNLQMAVNVDFKLEEFNRNVDESLLLEDLQRVNKLLLPSGKKMSYRMLTILFLGQKAEKLYLKTCKLNVKIVIWVKEMLLTNRTNNNSSSFTSMSSSPRPKNWKLFTNKNSQIYKS